jgi:hypothetical protein
MIDDQVHTIFDCCSGVGLRNIPRGVLHVVLHREQLFTENDYTSMFTLDRLEETRSPRARIGAERSARPFAGGLPFAVNFRNTINIASQHTRH